MSRKPTGDPPTHTRAELDELLRKTMDERAHAGKLADRSLEEVRTAIAGLPEDSPLRKVAQLVLAAADRVFYLMTHKDQIEPHRRLIEAHHEMRRFVEQLRQILAQSDEPLAS